MLRLEVVSAGGDEEILEFSTFPVVIGREGACEVVIDDQKASRRHCAIESSDGSARLVDLGSRNGTYLNDERVTGDALATGDVIRIGKTMMRVDDLVVEEAISAAASPPGSESSTEVEDERTGEESDRSDTRVVENRVVRSLGRRKLVGALGAAVVFLVVIAGAVLWFVTEYERQKEEKAKPPVVSTQLLEARAELAELKAEAARRELIDAAFVFHVKNRVQVIRDVEFGDGVRPFQELYSTLRDRLEVETHNRIAALVRRRDELIRAGDFGALLRLVREEGRSIAAANPRKDDAIDALMSSVDRAVAVGIEDLQSETDYFVSMYLPVEARRVYQRALDTFAGTSHVAKIRQLGDELEKSLAAAERRRVEEDEARKTRLAALRTRYERSRQPKGASRKDEPTDLEKLLALLRPKLAQGATLADAGSIEPASVLELAAEHLDGKGLLLAARFGYGSELAKKSDRLLLKYHGSRGKDGLEADRPSSRLLASVRGLGSVPDGGFVYSRRHGWEAAPDLARRLALADVKKISRKIVTAKNASSLLERFTDAVEVVERPALAGEARREVRSAVISSLEALRVSTTEKLVKRVQHTAFRRLREARAELDRRRAAALEVIFDPKIYLPENHPDWGKGDKVNGQAAVDAAVAQVRELWDSAATFAIRLDPKSSTYSDLVRTIDETCFQKLHHDPGAATKASRKESKGKKDEPPAVDVLDEIRRNLDARIDLKTYVRDSRELGLYRANRKVENYNQNLDHEDVSESDKSHVKVVNDYREMMGRRRVSIDPRLCRATRKHSEACNTAGRIWHSGPDGSPSSRARAEGFPGGVAENVAMGYDNPEGIWWRGWYRASDHHRNAMGAGHSCIGYGYVGRVGTQNFSSVAVSF